MRGDAPIEPADGALHGFAHAGGIGGGGDEDVVELHHDVGADGVLKGHGVFWGQEHGRAVVGGEEADAFFGDGGELEEGHHLEAVEGCDSLSVSRFSYESVKECDRTAYPPLSVRIL